MKRLSINRIAAAGIQANKRSYAALATGIFLSIFLVSALCMGVHGLFLAQEEKHKAAYGSQDAFWLGCDLSDAELMETGLYSEIGHVYVTAMHLETGSAVGYYDETAAAMLSRRFIEGRMPEKPGEIAIEQSKLSLLRMDDAGVGDSITLTLTPYEGVAEERTYTIVGLLTEQSAVLSGNDSLSYGWYYKSDYHIFPAILTCADDTAYATGSILRHNLFRLAPNVTKFQALNYYLSRAGDLYITSANGRPTNRPEDALQLNSDTLFYMVAAALLTGSLLLATCVGIAGSMESQLSRKREEIGMLRAVGATRRQIRRIMGRETWLLALLLSPIAVGAGLLAAWIVRLILPTYFIFRPSLWLLLPILLISMATILLAGYQPLRRASTIMPMSVMRDTEMLRRMKRLRPRKAFRPARLVAWRQLSIRPARQILPTVLMTLMFIIVSLTAYIVWDMAQSAISAATTEQPNFSIMYGYVHRTDGFYDDLPAQNLTAADIAQLRSLPRVTRVEVEGSLMVSQELPENVPDYWLPHVLPDEVDRSINFEETWGNGHPFLLPPEQQILTRYDVPALYEAVRTITGVSHHLSSMIELEFLTTLPANLEASVVSGDIDLAALNAGREVLVCAPPVSAWLTEDGTLLSINQALTEEFKQRQASRGYTLLDVIENDAYTAGQTLALHHLSSTDNPDLPLNYTYDQYLDFYAPMTHRRTEVTAGAVLDASVGSGNVRLITTEQGIRSMGLDAARITYVKIYTEALTEEEEDALHQRIRTIAMRGGNAECYNHLAGRRENETTQYIGLSLLIGVALIFLAICIAQISGNVTRSIRADVRMIGTLRAAGADAGTIFRCYSLQVVMSVVIGTVAGLIIYWLGLNNLPDFWIPADDGLLLAVQLTFSLTALGACLLILRLRIREVTRHPIVENIREL